MGYYQELTFITYSKRIKRNFEGRIYIYLIFIPVRPKTTGPDYVLAKITNLPKIIFCFITNK